jgi:hypothetical protein
MTERQFENYTFFKIAFNTPFPKAYQSAGEYKPKQFHRRYPQVL